MHPKNDFLYTFMDYDQYICLTPLQQKLGLTKSSPHSNTKISENKKVNCNDIDLYIYHLQMQSSAKIDSIQAQKLKLTNQSPEDFRINSYCYPNQDWGFWGSWNSSNGVCLEKNNYHEKLYFKNNPAINNKNFIFLGWILSDKQ